MDRRANMVSGKGKRRINSSKYRLSSIVYNSKSIKLKEIIKKNI